MIRGILLDKDGTLIDFDATWGPAVYRAMGVMTGRDRAALERVMAVSLYREEERRFEPASPLVGGSSAEYGPLWADALGREAGPALYREMDELFARFGLETLTPIDDPAAILRDLAARGLALGIATNDAEGSARAQVEALGLAGLVTYVAGYDSGFGSKPDPGMVTGFVRQTGLAPQEVALVGDSVHDLVAARRAGAVAVAVLTGPSRLAARPEIEPHADHVIGRLADLPAWLDAQAAGSASPSLAAGA